MLGAAVGAGEERILAVQRNRTDGALDDVGVDLDRTAVEESCQTLPAREHVADGFRQLGLLADKGELLPKPRLKGIDDGTASRLPDGAAFVVEATADIALNAVSWAMRASASVAIGAEPDCASS